MDATSFIWFLVIGAIAGWVAGLLMRGRGFGLAGNIVVGILGAILGGLILPIFGVGTAGIAGLLIMAVIGAVILLFLANLISRPRLH